jgi:hypothetical protein
VGCGTKLGKEPGITHDANYYLVRRCNDDSLARPAPISSLERELIGLLAKVFTSKRVKTGTVQIGSFFHRFHGIRHLLGTFRLGRTASASEQLPEVAGSERTTLPGRRFPPIRDLSKVGISRH